MCAMVEHGDMKTQIEIPARLPCGSLAAPLCFFHPDQLQEIIGSDGILYLRLADGNSAPLCGFPRCRLVPAVFEQMGRYPKTRDLHTISKGKTYGFLGGPLDIPWFQFLK